MLQVSNFRAKWRERLSEGEGLDFFNSIGKKRKMKSPL